MKFTIVKDPLPYLYIEEIFNKEELQQVYQELLFLHPKLLLPEDTGTAINVGGNLKSNTGVFLDELYTRRNFSNILTLNRKLFSAPIFDSLEKCCPGYDILHGMNKDDTLISYYEDNDYYRSHKDRAAISIVSWFFKHPKNFTGGDFIFSKYNKVIEPKNNSGIIFFSCYPHEVTNIKMINKDIPASGRFSMTMFCKYV